MNGSRSSRTLKEWAGVRGTFNNFGFIDYPKISHFHLKLWQSPEFDYIVFRPTLFPSPLKAPVMKRLLLPICLVLIVCGCLAQPSLSQTDSLAAALRAHPQED